MKGNESTSTSEPVVNFSIETRQLTPEQIEAGKRLFKNLVTRAQKEVEDGKHYSNNKATTGEGGPAAAGGLAGT